ncbi:MAG: sugar phosphate isomerase/epimerase, partial [Clostridia bacterium]|nr:sugar phosphate isomerase/epimerase [Clostridia bacterium]
IEHTAELNEICQNNGMTLAIEVLPRTCLGNCSDEILRFVEAIPGLKVCFDVNHLLKEDHSTFIKKVGKYIVTTHISDYDFVDEKHWFPLDGKIDWKKLQEDLEAADYSGPFLYETGLPGNRVLSDVKKNKLELEKL